MSQGSDASFLSRIVGFVIKVANCGKLEVTLASLLEWSWEDPKSKLG